MRAWRLLCLVFVCCIISANAQRCQDFLGQPPPCVPLISTPQIETPPGGNQTIFAATAGQIIALLNAADPVKCGPTATSFACYNLFRPCPTNNSNGPDPVQEGVRVCRSLCLRLLSDCAAIFSQFASQIPPGLVPNCTAVDTDGTPVFPNGTYIERGSDGNNYTRNCNIGPSPNTSIQCVPPLVFHSREAIRCQPPCPRRFLTKGRMRTMKIVTAIIAIPTLVADILMILLISITPQRRRWPAVIPLFMFIGNLIAIIGYLIGFVGGFNSVWCVGNEFAQEDKVFRVACVVSGAFFIYGLEVFCLWWAWQAVLIFEMAYFPFLVSQKWQQWVAHGITWGLPFVAIIITGTTHSFGYAGDAPVCFLRIDAPYSNSLFWYPVISLTCVVAPLLIATVVRLAMGGGWRALILQWRLLLMLFYSIATYALFCAFKFDLTRNSDAYRDSLGNWIICIMTNGSAKNCRLSKRPPFPMQLAFFIMWDCTGVVNALICGLDREFVATVTRLRRSGWREFMRESLSKSTSLSANSQQRDPHVISDSANKKSSSSGIDIASSSDSPN